jgi:hypothetical protein
MMHGVRPDVPLLLNPFVLCRLWDAIWERLSKRYPAWLLRRARMGTVPWPCLMQGEAELTSDRRAAPR